MFDMKQFLFALLLVSFVACGHDRNAEEVSAKEFAEQLARCDIHNLVADTTCVPDTIKQKLDEQYRSYYSPFNVEVYDIGYIAQNQEYVVSGSEMTGGYVKMVFDRNLKRIDEKPLIRATEHHLPSTHYAYSPSGIWAGQYWNCDEDNHAHILFCRQQDKQWHLVGVYDDTTWCIIPDEGTQIFWSNSTTLYVRGAKASSLNEPTDSIVYHKIHYLTK